MVAAADVQHNRIEAQITGFGPGEESWLIAHEVFWGNPGVEVDPETAVNAWEQLDQSLLKPWPHPCGPLLTPAIALVDAGAHADSVYDYVLPRQHPRRRIFACKGVDYLSKPGLVMEGSTKKANIRLFAVATYAAKDRVFARMKIPRPGPGYMHLPDWVTDEYLEQLTGEKLVPSGLSEGKITVRDKRTRTKPVPSGVYEGKVLYAKTFSRPVPSAS